MAFELGLMCNCIGRGELNVGTYRSIVCRLWQEEKGAGELVARGVNDVLD